MRFVAWPRVSSIALAVHRAASAGALVFAASMAVASCASAPDAAAPYLTDQLSSPQETWITTSEEADAGSSDAGCTKAREGCPCPVENEAIECGTLHETFGDYVRCSPMFRTCKDGFWSE